MGNPISFFQLASSLATREYGTIPGEVTFVSGDAIQGGSPMTGERSELSSSSPHSDASDPVYTVRIRPLKGSIEADSGKVKLIPGMAVTAEIKTGKRRVIEYILDPIIRYRDESFTER